MKRLLFFLFLLVPTLLIHSLEREVNLLLIYSFHNALPWITGFNSGVERAKEEYENITVFTEHLDINLLNSPLSQKEWESYLEKKYSNIKIDAILAESDPASRLVNSMDTLFLDTPRVLYVEEPLMEKSNTYYLIDQWNIAVSDTLNRAIEQNPHAKRLILIDGGLETNRVIEGHINSYISNSDNLTLEVWPLTTLNQLKVDINRLEDDVIFFYTLIFTDDTGERYIPKLVLKELTELASSPIYSFWSSLLGSGIVGGNMIDGEKTAFEMVRASLDFLEFGKFGSNYSTLQQVIDWKTVKEYSIDTSTIDRDTRIINKPEPIFIKYYREITTTMLVIIAILFILSLFWLEKAKSVQKILDKARIKAESEARHDHLTGLKNRLACTPILEYEIRRKHRINHSTSLMIVDIDNFKHVNDTYGHDVGDIVLKAVAEDIPLSVRSTDTIARWGGEEFIVLAPDTSSENARILADKIRLSVEKLRFKVCRPVTISIGVAELTMDDDFNTWFEKADKALYKAKELGRNRVETFE